MEQVSGLKLIAQISLKVMLLRRNDIKINSSISNDVIVVIIFLQNCAIILAHNG